MTAYIAWMNYYKGNVNGNDQPQNGGSYVLKNGDAHEKYNFSPVLLSKDNTFYPDGEYCLGFVETKSTNGKTRNQLNIERIEGCETLKNENEVEDVLVIYCAKFPDSSAYETYVFCFPADCVAAVIYGVCQGKRVGFLMDLDSRMFGSHPAPIRKTV